jgi:hypothetical protein
MYVSVTSSSPGVMGLGAVAPKLPTMPVVFVRRTDGRVLRVPVPPLIALYPRGIGRHGFRGLGQSTLATNVPAFCAGLDPQDVSAYPACAALSPATIAAARGSTPAGQSNALAQQYAPPVYTSSFVAQVNTGSLPVSYYDDQTAATVVDQVNVYNSNAYAQYLNALNNYLMYPGVALPTPPVYEDPGTIYAQQGLGPLPSSVGQAPAGTPMPTNLTPDTLNPISNQVPALNAPTPPAVSPAPPPQQPQQPQGGVIPPANPPSAPVTVAPSIPVGTFIAGSLPTAPNIGATGGPTTPTTSSSPLSFLMGDISIFGFNVPVLLVAAVAIGGVWILTSGGKRH